MPEDEGESGPPGPRDGDDEDVETWPPEDQEASPRPRAASPDHEQARQGPRDPPPSRDPGTGDHRGMGDAEARNWAAGAHLASLVALLGVPSIVGPLVVWLVKREDHPFVADQARESLNFQLSVIIYAIVGALAALVFVLATLGMGMLVVLPVAFVFVVGVLVLPIYAAIRASDGERYRYPLTLRLISGRQREPAPA